MNTGARTVTADINRTATRVGYLAANLWLLFLLFPLLSMLASDIAGWRKVAAVAVLVLFAAAHALGYRSMIREELGGLVPDTPDVADTPDAPGAADTLDVADTGASLLASHQREAWFATMVALAVTGVGIGGWPMLGVAPFLVSFAFFNFDWGAATWIFVATMAGVVIPPAIGGVLDDLWFFSVIVGSVGSGSALVSYSEDRATERAAFEKQLALSDERQRVARDVHDVLGHSLTAVILKGQVIGRILERLDLDDTADQQLVASARSQLVELDTVSRRALAEIRSTIGGLRSADLGDEIAAARAVLADAGVSLVVIGDAATTAEPIRPVLGWVVREAVTNVVRHAQADNCEIVIGVGENATILAVSDDGVGLTGDEGNGLTGLRERVAAAGAELRVEQGPGGGTVLQVMR